MSLLLLPLMPLLAPATWDEASEVAAVKVSVLVILASEAGTEVDKHLEAIAKDVQKHSPHLKSFKTRAYESQALAHEQKGTFKLVDQQIASVVVKRPPEGSSRADLGGIAVQPVSHSSAVPYCYLGYRIPDDSLPSGGQLYLDETRRPLELEEDAFVMAVVEGIWYDLNGNVLPDS